MTINKYKYKLFGRFRGRKKLNTSSLQYLEKYKINIKKNINNNNYNILDIGSGSGENAIFLSKKNCNAIVMTCELFEDGNINLFNQIFIQNINNIYLYQGNVLEFLDKLDQKNFFNEIWILFPDPWPKNRHHKRRLINNNFFKTAYYFLKNSGKLMIATDSKPYTFSIIETIYDCQNLFLWKNQNFEGWNYDILELPKTKFYKKALIFNRKSIFFELSKI